ncbi:hypothetical protein NFI96_025158, partial [Prochilodus magdalenae]
GKAHVALPPLLECNTVPDEHAEIPTPDTVQLFPHLAPVAGKIPPIEEDMPILLLLGRGVLTVHKACEQYNGPHNTPYAQRLDLGWVITEVCDKSQTSMAALPFLSLVLVQIHIKEKFILRHTDSSTQTNRAPGAHCILKKP